MRILRVNRENLHGTDVTRHLINEYLYVSNAITVYDEILTIYSQENINYDPSNCIQIHHLPPNLNEGFIEPHCTILTKSQWQLCWNIFERRIVCFSRGLVMVKVK